MTHVLIVDDEPDILELLSMTLRRMKLNPVAAQTVSEAKQALQTQTFDLCLTDMRLPDGSGLDLVKHIHELFPSLPTVMITAYGSMNIAIEAIKSGAFDFLAKPVELERLRSVIQNALNLEQQQQQSDEETAIPGIIGRSEPILLLNRQIRKVALSHAPVFIHGESGSGKERVARAIHALGPRSDAPFIAVNCGAIPSELMESEFFGHKRGAFTGATNSKDGFFQAAHGGTLFLDEVADLPLNMQVKLLRAIQENRIRPVGSETETPVDVRILSASHKNLAQEVLENNFRQDLFFRLDVINIPVPPLHERMDDLPLLIQHILQRLCTSLELPVSELSQDALDALQKHRFPGNVRELENILQRAITLSDGHIIQPADLQLKRLILTPSDSTEEHTPASTSQAPQSHTQDAADATPHEQAAHTLREGESLDQYLEEAERQIIQRALTENRWNKTAAAEQLGISFRSMRYRLKKLGID